MGEAHVADLLRALLDRAGFHVVSRWTDRLRTQSVRPSREEMAAIHRANSAELDDADLVVAWTAAGTPRATYSEIGYALARGKPVLWLQGPNGEGSNSYDTEALVRVLAVDLGETGVERDVAIVAAVQEMVEEQRERVTASKPCGSCGHDDDEHRGEGDGAGCGVPHPVHGWCPCEGYVSESTKGAA
jgi:nucleoside 2-deoxyribosyltransferase